MDRVDDMKTPEIVVLVGVSVALVALGTGVAWMNREVSFGSIAPSTAPTTVQPENAPPTPNPFDRFDAIAPAPKELGFIDQWRFDSCMTDAAKNPTAHGVNTAARVCRRRFDQ